MEVKVTGTKHELFLEGPISEKTTIYDYNLKNATEVVLDMQKVTFINSIGVKNWILWTMRVPDVASITLLNCPFVIVNQASMVQGFLPVRARIHSFYAPFVCPDCGAEHVEKLFMGKHYHYVGSEKGRSIELPIINCPKCKAEMEADFIEAKTFAFLDPK